MTRSSMIDQIVSRDVIVQQFTLRIFGQQQKTDYSSEGIRDSKNNVHLLSKCLTIFEKYSNET